MEMFAAMASMGGSCLIGLLTLIAMGVAGWKIAEKAGYAPAWGLLAMVPLVGYVAILYFAFTEWPIEKQVQELKNK